MIKKLPYLFAALITVGCQQEKVAYDLIIKDVQVIDVEKNHVLADQFVAIADDTIRLVAEMNQLNKYSSEAVIDGKGQYIMPGLWDMHVHFRGGEDLIDENKELLSMFLEHGVTTVRDAGGDITPTLLRWRNQIKAKELMGPYIFTPGPKLDGANPTWQGSIQLTNIDQVSTALDSLEGLGVEYVKIYDSKLDTAIFYEILRQAESRGLKTTGHMPMAASFKKAIDLGLDGSEHLYYPFKACSSAADSLTALGKGYGILGELVNTYDPSVANQLFEKMAARKVSVTPTLYIGSVLNGLATVDHSKDKLLSRMGDIQATYSRRINSAKRASDATREMRNGLSKKFKAMIKAMYDRGVTIFAGSDCGAYNSFVYPGQSLHGELIALVDAGLTPHQALNCSVINGPAFFGLEDVYGSVEKGRVADLILLADNPLTDIHAIQDIRGVLVKGELY